MNTVSKETREAEQNLEAVWGGLPRKPCLMIEGGDPGRALWQEAERLGEFLRREKEAGVLAGDLPRAALLPGPKEQESNLKAWREFWTRDRIAALKTSLQEEGAKMGFKADAFAPFFRILQEDRASPAPDSRRTLPLFRHLPRKTKRTGVGCSRTSLRRGPSIRGRAFLSRAPQEGFLSFDSGHFSRHLTRELNRSFHPDAPDRWRGDPHRSLFLFSGLANPSSRDCPGQFFFCRHLRDPGAPGPPSFHTFPHAGAANYGPGARTRSLPRAVLSTIRIRPGSEFRRLPGHDPRLQHHHPDRLCLFAVFRARRCCGMPG